MKKLQRKCATCKWLKPREDGKPFHHAHAYKCRWPMPEIALPASVARKVWNDTPGSYMAPSDGADCPCWEARGTLIKIEAA